MNHDKIIQGIMDIGESLLCTGAEIYRVQDSIDRMCASYGFLRQDVFVIQNNIQITVETKEHEMITQIRHIETTGFNYDRLDALNGLSRYICTNRPDDEELQKRYREIMDAPTQKAWIIVLAQIVGGTSFAVFFGCNFGDALIALVLSVFIVFFGKWLEKREENLLIYNLILSFLSEIFVVLAFRAGITGHPDWIMIGVVMLLVSSLGLINGIRDVMQANHEFTAGSIWNCFRNCICHDVDEMERHRSFCDKSKCLDTDCILHNRLYRICKLVWHPRKKDGIFRNRRIHYMGNLFACICMQWK